MFTTCYNPVPSVLFHLMHLVEIYFKKLKDIMNEVGFNRNVTGRVTTATPLSKLEGRGVDEQQKEERAGQRLHSIEHKDIRTLDA